jgi:type IV secretory pathway ATPase VirB11/archaellum biosynthesis ATPase/intein/homing endonuclease
MDVPKLDFNVKVPQISYKQDKSTVDVRYPLISPYANAHIYWDANSGEMVYELEEPLLTAEDQANLDKLHTAIQEMININVSRGDVKETMEEYLHKIATLVIAETQIKMSEEGYYRVFYYLYRDFYGLNEIEALMHDYFIEDIQCNGVGQPIYLVHRIFRNLRTAIQFNDVDRLASFVEKIAQKCGKYISYASPLLDGSLPDGSRVNATYTKDVSSRGPTFTIRKFTKTPFTPLNLIGFATISPEMLAFLWIMMQYKLNILIAGGTGSGKTTLLNAIAFFIPPEARVVSIEDSVSGDSKIIIKQNKTIRNVTIKEFVDNRIDAEVMTLDNNGKIIFVKPSDWIKHKVKKNIYEIKTSTGRRIRVTQDHSLFSLGNGKLVEVKPTELKENKSFIAVPRVLPIQGEEIKEINLMDYLKIFKDDFICGEPIKQVLERYNYHQLKVKKERFRWWKDHNLIKIDDFMKLKINFSYTDLCKLSIKSKNTSQIPVIFKVFPEFLEFCGLWLGDGSYDNYNKNSVILSNIDKECRNRLKDLAVYLGSNYSLMDDGGVPLRIHSSVFYKFMKYVLKFDGYSKTKQIPSFIFGLSNEQIKHFIRGYFSADGCIKKYEVSCASQSISILDDLQSLFLRFGIISRLNDFSRKDKCINMSISGYDNIAKFKDIGFLQERKNKILRVYSAKAHHDNSDIIPLTLEMTKELDDISLVRLQHGYLNGLQHLGRSYVQRIAPKGSWANDLSHNDILWDGVRSVKKISSCETEVFDLSIPKYEKFLCNNVFVHNTRELNLSRENWLPSVVRAGITSGGVGEVDMFSLLRASFRQIPDYVIVGEVRGPEAAVLFQGMASGHASMATIHADSVETVIRRLETPPINLSPSLVNELDAVAIMTHAVVGGRETRKLREVVEVINVTSDGVAQTNTPFMWDPAKDKFYFKKDSRVFEKIEKKFGVSVAELGIDFDKRVKLIYELYKRQFNDFEALQKLINEFYKNPQMVYSRFGIQ